MPPAEQLAQSLTGGAAAPVAPAIEAPPVPGAAMTGAPTAATQAAAQVDEAVLQRVMKWSKVAVRSSAKKAPQEVLRLLLADLKDQGVPKSIRREITLQTLRKGLPKRILKKLGDGADAAKDSVELARASLSGVKGRALNDAFEMLLTDLAEAGAEPRAIEQLRKFGAKRMLEHTPPKVLAAIAKRPPDAGVVNVVRRVFGRTVAQLPEGVSAAVAGEAVDPSTVKALAKSGVSGFGAASKVGGGISKVLKPLGPLSSLLRLGPALGVGAVALDAVSIGNSLSEIFGGKADRARRMAALGRTAEGGTVASADYLRQALETQAALAQARTSAVMHEPQLTGDVLRALVEGKTVRGRKVLAEGQTAHGSAAYLNDLARDRAPSRQDVLQQFDRLLLDLQ